MDEYVSVTKEELNDLLQDVKKIVSHPLVPDETKQSIMDALETALSGDAGFKEVFDRLHAAEQEKKAKVHEILSGDPVFMDKVEDLKNAEMYGVICGEVGLPQDENGLPQDEETLLKAKQIYQQRGLEVFEQRDSGNNYINNSPVLKRLERGGTGDIWLGDNPETGEPLVLTVYNGFLDPFEADITECICKFKNDGQVTKTGKPWCTRSQLYRALRHGAGTTRPTRAQLDSLFERVRDMSREERKIDFGLSDYVELGKMFPELSTIDMKTKRARLRIVSFDEFHGKIRGQEDWVIVFDNTPFLGRLAEYLRTGEIVPQEVKAVQYTRYYLEYKDGDTVKKKFFTCNEDRQKFCKRNGITGKNIIDHYEQTQPYTLTDQRIAIRHVLLSFVFSYMRARLKGKNHSNKLPYADIWQRCNVAVGTTMQHQRAKETVRIILDHLVNTIPELSRWTEYYNNGSRRADGVQISVSAAITEGGS